MANVDISKLINHNLYAKGNVNGLDGSLTTVKKTYSAGNLIGNIYSYIVRNGNVYYMVYANDYDYKNFKPTYILHDASKLDVPDLPDILQKIKNEKEIKDLQDQKKLIDEIGPVQYYTNKYLPYVIGAIVIAIALPSIIKTFKNGK
jgi:hypothetical protein